MASVTSKDGTTIGYDKTGSGPALVIVDGALGYRGLFPGEDPLVKALAEHFTVVFYDRRGRGESSDALYETGGPLSEAVQREVDDLEAIIDAAGGKAFLYGVSSGAALVLEAAIRLEDKVEKIALYEAPFNDDPAARQAWKQYTVDLGRAIAEGRRGDAVALFIRLTGASEEDVANMRGAPIFGQFESLAHTLAYDHTALMGEEGFVPLERAARVRVPALVMDGSASYPFMHPTAVKLAEAIPNAVHRTLEGQTHEVQPETVAPELVRFFKA